MLSLLSRHTTRRHLLAHARQFGLPVCSSSPYSTFASSVSANPPQEEVRVWLRHGLPVFAVPLPSRRERCHFTLRPISQALADLARFIQEEDRGVDRVAAYTPEGARLAGSTPIDVLLQSEFVLAINDRKYTVSPCIQESGGLAVGHESAGDLDAVKNTVAQLYSALHVEHHQLERERRLLQTLEDINTQLAPMEELKQELDAKAKKRTDKLAWVGLGLMGFQFGLLARLTWFEYSWDIMEPITYFVTYGTSMAMFAYYVLTKQEYNFAEVRDREHLLSLHRHAEKLNFDITRYNELRSSLTQTELDLRRLRDPLQLQLPLQQLLAREPEGDSPPPQGDKQ